MFEIDYKGLILPFAYIGVLLGSLITFSSLYRKRKAGKSTLKKTSAKPKLSSTLYNGIFGVMIRILIDLLQLPPRLLRHGFLRICNEIYTSH